MPRSFSRPLLLIVALTGAGCPLTPEIVGETLPTTGDAQGASTTTGGDTTAGEGVTTGDGPTTGQTTGAGGADGAYGSSCRLMGSPPVINHTAVSPQPACDGGICLTIIADECANDLECEVNVGEGSTCDVEGICTVTLALVDKHSRCTQTCETVEDCPAIPGCATGITCSAVVVSGELCCQRVCLCDDDAYLPGIMSFQELCDDEPGLCA